LYAAQIGARLADGLAPADAGHLPAVLTLRSTPFAQAPQLVVVSRMQFVVSVLLPAQLDQHEHRAQALLAVGALDLL
jgi:hypothetical protein